MQEKLIDALSADTVPIYYGVPDVELDINPSTYIDVSKFESQEEAIEVIERIDKDEEQYLSFFRENPIEGNPYVNWEDNLCEFITNILERGSKLSVPFGAMGSISRKLDVQERLYAITPLRKRIDFIEQLMRKCQKIKSFRR